MAEGSVLQSGTTVGTKPPELQKEGNARRIPKQPGPMERLPEDPRRVNSAALQPSGGSPEERVRQQPYHFLELNQY
ncbi:unnamed protein product [Arctogadus glacialis]